MSTNISFIALFLVLLLVNYKLVHSQDVTSFSYSTFDPSTTKGLTYQGAAHVPSDSNFLRLIGTNPSTGRPQSNSVGRVVYTRPVSMWESSSGRQAAFETTLKFIITPSKGGNCSDGLAFFIAPVNTTIPPNSGGGNLGVFQQGSYSRGQSKSTFAVEFDTYSHPWDPKYQHIGIDVEDVSSRSTVKFDIGTGLLVKAVITFDPNLYGGLLKFVVTSGTKTTDLPTGITFKSFLPEKVQVGISATTGGSQENNGVFDLISWEFTSSLLYITSRAANIDEK